MKLGLQARTTLTLLATLVPLVTLFTVQRIHVEKRSRDEQRLERLVTRIGASSDAFCTRKKLPRRARLPLKGAHLFFYDTDFEPRQTQAPALSSRQRLQVEGLDAEDAVAHFPAPFLRAKEPNAPHGYTLARLDEGSASCRVLFITWPRPRPAFTRPMLQIVLPQAVVLTLLLLISGLLIAVPLVRRIRRLTGAVQHATATRHWRIEDVERHGGDELGDLARAFDEAGQEIGVKIRELEARDLTLKEYISNTTHDLAIPLTVIQHRLSRMQRAARAGEVIESDWISGALEESHYIAALIANMSALARLEAGDVHQLHHPVDLGELVERVISRHEPIASQRQLELAWSVPPEAMVTSGDSTLIERALSNLVQNAIQYNDAGGHIALVLEQDSPGRCAIRVMDDGPGIPAELITTFGERAALGDEARNRNPGGQGFGLSIVHKVCAQHHWRVRFTSTSDEPGLTVTLDQIPLRSPD